MEGGSNIIKKNEISINNIGSSSDSNDDDISYFGLCIGDYTNTDFYNVLMVIFPLRKGVHFIKNPANTIIGLGDIFDSSAFYELGGNINNKSIYQKGIWYSIKELLSLFGFHIEQFKPISKEDFYRTDYTKEEAKEIEQDYYNYYLQNAPSEP